MKIQSIEINSFRGIPHKCILGFASKNGPCSAIIYGGNGSGKSSIIDSIEFGLQARIGRSRSLNNPQRPKTYNLCVNESMESSINVLFDDNSILNRKVLNEFSAKGALTRKIYPTDPHPLFNKAPIVLRRSDIIAFNNTKEAERQVLLSQFLYDNTGRVKLAADPEIASLEEQVLANKKKRRELMDNLARISKIDYADLEDNLNLRLFEFIKSRITYEGANPKKLITKSGYKKRNVSHKLYTFCLKTAEECDKYSEIIKNIQAKITQLKKVDSRKASPITSKLQDVFSKSATYLSSSFKKISNADFVQDIGLSIGKQSVVSFNISITLSNGVVVSPTDIFSEANYDLMVLLLYMSIIRVGVDDGQPPILILDDVLQSVDSSIRANFIDYVLEEMPDWQLFITCHDRLWLEQLKYLFNRKGHSFKEFHVTGWEFSKGPSIKEVKASSIDDTLHDAIKTENPQIIASVSGPFLEKICNELSFELGCTIKRVRGDKYTLGDLWPSVCKVLKKMSIKEAEEVDHLLYIRNLLGCHYNDWAKSMSDEEIYLFANSIQRLYEHVFCCKCYTWVHKISDGGIGKACKCGELKYNN